ncbi:MAG: c-type cytochrome [Gemmatimonadaceae bacterium]
MTPNETRSRWRAVRIAAAIVVAAGAIGAAMVYLGVYNVAADVPHTRPVFWLLETARDRAVDVRARAVRVPPDLVDTTRIVDGAGLYDDMCASCHLAPGMEKTEISQGLYPRAPELARRSDRTPAEEFWIIKHGLKMTGMAAWGKTHSDTLIWDMVAFLQKLPTLSPDQYTALVKSAPEDHDDMMKAQKPAR